MQIFINNKVAALKKGSSFEFIAENRYFSGADSYTLAITFPIKDCPQNIAIFGHINRKDVQTKNLLFDCVIRDRNMERYGAITVTEIDDTEVKCQFLEGQSVQNYDVAFDEIYINDLELGYPADASNIAWAKVNFPAENLRNSLSDGQNWQALPWVNNYSGNLQNGLIQHGDSTWHWQTSSPNLSFQPYLVYIIERIFGVLGYTCDTSSIRVSRFANLLICNTLPSAWNIYNFAKALPHWTLTEFLEQLELLFGGFFEIDKTQKTVSFTFTRSESAVRGSVHLHRVVDNYTCKHQNTVSRSAKGYAVRYADCDHRMWKYYSCQHFIERLENGSFRCREENSIDGAISFMNIDNTYPQYYNPGFDFRVGTEPPYKYYMERTRKVVNAPNNQYMITYGMQRLNLCGMPETDEDTKELKLVPVWLDELSPESGYVIFLQCPELEYEGRYSNDINMSDAEYVLSLGDKQKQTEFFDKIYIGYWDGGQIYGAELHPYIDTIDFISGSTYLTRPHTLDITTINEDKYMNDITLDKTVKYTFKFLADSIPNPRDIFYIQGKRYICEKITATFTEEGMSQLLKGDFYPVED